MLDIACASHQIHELISVNQRVRVRFIEGAADLGHPFSQPWVCVKLLLLQSFEDQAEGLARRHFVALAPEELR